MKSHVDTNEAVVPANEGSLLWHGRAKMWKEPGPLNELREPCLPTCLDCPSVSVSRRREGGGKGEKEGGRKINNCLDCSRVSVAGAYNIRKCSPANSANSRAVDGQSDSR